MLSGLVISEVRLLYRRRQELVNPLIFFLMVCTLFPLAVTPEAERLREMAPGIIWVAATLASLLSLDMLFKHDFEEGALEQLLFSNQPLYLLALMKTACYWLMTGLPLVIVSPLLGLMLFVPSEAMLTLMLTLLLGTPVLSFIGGIGAALTVSLKRGGVVISLLILPLFMPVLIFGSSAVAAAAQGLPVNGHIAWMLVLLLMSVLLAPLAIATAIRISIAAD